MKRIIFSLISILLILTLISCTATHDENIDNATDNTTDKKFLADNTSFVTEEFVMPETLINENDYRAQVDKLSSVSSYEKVDKAYVSNIDTLRQNLYNLIMYNQDTPKYTGTAYYVSPYGNDRNDGKTPETAWATLDKVNVVDLKEGDAVLFQRGGIWWGVLSLQDGVTYSAYGKGFKPKIYAAINGKTYAEWVETDTENIWKLDKRLNIDDIGTVVLNNDTSATFVRDFKSLDRNYEFLFGGPASKEPHDYFLYIYCDKGNPAEVFEEIHISIKSSVAKFYGDKTNIVLHGLELSYGQDFFYSGSIINMKASYCSFRWSGGQWAISENLRFGGGGGAEGNCDGISIDHCYIYQQFDSGVTIQGTGNNISFKNFSATDCIFEKVEYPFEYFAHLKNINEPFSNIYEYIYFGYNICYDTGGGFGDKRSRSACIVGNSDRSQTINCVIEKNIFDRAQANSVIMRGQDVTGNPIRDNLFKLKSNVYIIARSDKNFATINGTSYKADLEGFNKYVADAYEQNPVMRIIP